MASPGKTLPLMLVCALAGAVAPAGAQTSGQFLPQYNRIAAIAEGEVITFQEIRNKVLPFLTQISIEARSQEEFNRRVDELQRQLLEDEINKILIVKDAEEKGLTIPEAFVEQEYERRISEDFGGDQTRFLEYLKALNKTRRDYREEIRKDVIVQVMSMEQAKTQRIVSPEQVAEYYYANKLRFYQHEGVRLRQIILLPRGPSSDPRPAAERAAEVIGKLEQGAAFGDLARQYSQDEMARKGGDWGWIRRQDIRKELSDVAFSLEPGSWSEAVELGGNRFILMVDEKREEGIQPLAEVRDVIEAQLRDEIAREAQQQWLARLREKSYVKYYDFGSPAS